MCDTEGSSDGGRSPIGGAGGDLEAEVPDRRRAALAGHEGDPSTALALARHADPDVRATALAALARIGALDDDRLAGALADESPTVRRRGLELAVAFPAVPVVDLLADPDDPVAEQAAWALGEREEATDDIVDRLAAMATAHADALCREAAVAALGALGAERGLPAILAATGDRATVRRRAVLALSPFDGPDVDAALERARHDKDWQVRQAAEDLLRDD